MRGRKFLRYQFGGPLPLYLLGGFLDLGPFFGLISHELIDRFLQNLRSYTSHVNRFFHRTLPVKRILCSRQNLIFPVFALAHRN